MAFDAVQLTAAKPDLQLLKLPMVDTLRLNPLAFPRNPYHHLVKHYQDGQLKRGRLNDPELDARLTLTVFRDQHRELVALNASAPDLLLAWHWLTTTNDATSGLNNFFFALRGKPRPDDVEAKAAIAKRMAGSTCMTVAGQVVADAQNQGWALGIYAGLVVGCRRQFGDTAMGAASVPGHG